MSVFAAQCSSVILITGAVPPAPEAVALAEKKCSALFTWLKAMVKTGGLVGCLELDFAFLSRYVNWETRVS